MRMALKAVLSLAVVLGFLVLARADEGKEETLKGTITCAKCDLKLIKGKCHTVVKVKDTVYWFDPDGSKKYHKPICTEPKEGTVTGTVSEKDGKKWVKVSKVDFDK
jgi:hypothetical protein